MASAARGGRGGGRGDQGGGVRETYATFSISEEARIAFTTQLKRLRENPDEEEVKYPSTLDNIERKFIHHLAGQLGLVSKSRGQGTNRYLTVFKSKKRQDDDGDHNGYPLLEVSNETAEAISTHLARYRLSDAEREALCAREASEAAHSVYRHSRSQDSNRSGATSGARKAQQDAERHARFRAQYESSQKRRAENPTYKPMLEARKKLPAWEHKDMVVRLVKENQVVIVSGDTGCGKSTQVPQFLLDDPEIGPGLRMAVTQPRRISAIAVAERVASERLEDVGRVVGYNIRLESQVSDLTQVTFMTPGVLLRKLRSDPMLLDLTHVVLDEVHERDQNTDFLLIILRDVLSQRPDLRVILMSATLQSTKLSTYFSSCPVATIGSTRFPVQEFFLEDVLLQTGYVKLTGGGKGASTDPLLKALCEKQRVYTCDLCGRRGIRSPEEYGTHIVLCDGTPDGSSGADGTQPRINFKSIEVSLLKDIRSGRGHALQYADDDGDTDVNAWLDPRPPPPLETTLHASDLGDPAESPFRHDPRVAGVFGRGGIPRAATEVEAQEALRRYQFDFDDEMVDYNLIRELLVYICQSGYEDGAVLVFLPGWDDISRLRDMLKRDKLFCQESKFIILPLHSGIPSKQQREVFKRPPPGARKVVLATNIAETSITIDDIAFVVDSARVKEKAYDPFLKLCTLQPTWISKASARQRKGRAGRTTAGVCFHLCSRRRFESLREFRESELLTTPLEELCLQAKALGVAPGGPDSVDGLAAFLSRALDAPMDLTVRNAIELLQQIGALDKEQQLTELGWKLAAMPMDPKIGKMVLWGQMLGCGKSALKVACGMAYRDPFVLPLSSEQKSRAERAKQDLAAGTMSDHVALLNALLGYERVLKEGGVSGASAFCDRSFLSRSTLMTVLDVVRQMMSELEALGFASPFARGSATDTEGNLAMLAAVVCAGLYPGVAKRQRGDMNFTTSCDKKAKIHQSSVNAMSGSRFTRTCLSAAPEYLVFSEVIRTPAVYLMSSTTPVPALSLLLLCGRLRVRGVGTTQHVEGSAVDKATTTNGAESRGINGADGSSEEDDDESDGDEAWSHEHALLELDDWLTLRCDKELAVQLQVLRLRLQQAFVAFIRRPQSRMAEAHSDAIRVAARALTLENQDLPQRVKDGRHETSHTGSGSRIGWGAPRAILARPQRGGNDVRIQHHSRGDGGVAGGVGVPVGGEGRRHGGGEAPTHVHGGGRHAVQHVMPQRPGPRGLVGAYPFQPHKARGRGDSRRGGGGRGAQPQATT